jgi:hypothetical protein
VDAGVLDVLDCNSTASAKSRSTMTLALAMSAAPSPGASCTLTRHSRDMSASIWRNAMRVDSMSGALKWHSMRRPSRPR